MEIEFIKETDLKETWYYTKSNGMPVSGSFSKDKDEAYNMFIKIVEMKGVTKSVEILETIKK